MLWTLDRAADALSNVIWDSLPDALGVDPNGWWIILILTLTGLAVGIALQVLPGTAVLTRRRPSSSPRRCRFGLCPAWPS